MITTLPATVLKSSEIQQSPTELAASRIYAQTVAMTGCIWVTNTLLSEPVQYMVIFIYSLNRHIINFLSHAELKS